MNTDNEVLGLMLVIFNLLVALGIGFIAFGILACIFGIHIWTISISIGLSLLIFAFSFVIEKVTGILVIKRK